MAEKQQPENTGRQQGQGAERQAQQGERDPRQGTEGRDRQDTGGYGREGASTRQVSSRVGGDADQVTKVPDDVEQQFEGSQRPEQGGQRQQ